MNSVCLGPEFTTDGSGNLIVANTRAQAWPYGTGCPPSSASGLRLDPTLGLWVDPLNLSAFHDEQPLPLGTTFALNAYTSTGAPNVTITNPSSCLPMQAILWHTFRFHGVLPLHSYVQAKMWVAPSTVTQPADSSLSTYDSYHCWTDAAAEFAITATLIRRLALAPGAAVSLVRYMSLYSVNLASGGTATPTITDGSIETTGYGLTQLGPVTDIVS